nr:DUF2829 domain-containing protein [uncultured Anaerobutyricum sp.]
MIFKEVLEVMKKGAKVKLPSWGGYWYWDDDKKTIIMHTRDGEELDIRQTDRPEYTFSNVASDEWQVADEKNCPELGGVATFSFGDAIKYLKRGLKVSRKGWNGKGMYLFLADGEDLTSCLSEGDFECASSVCMKTAQNTICVGWLASQADMLSEDWTFFE